MPDLNKQITEVEKSSKEIKLQLNDLLRKYESLYREGSNQFNSERIASAGSMDGLEEFRKVILLIKRNRDIVASLIRGISSFRPLSNFRFVEEEVHKPVPRKKDKKIKSAVSEIMVPEYIESEG